MGVAAKEVSTTEPTITLNENAMSPLELNQNNLNLLSDCVQKPAYDRSKVTAGIVHIGVGGFHRSHEAFYTDEWLGKSDDLGWGICGVGLREGDRKIAEVLRKQDYLYTLIVRHPNGTIQNRVIGSLVDFMLGCDDQAAVTKQMADPAIRIVSLTITEGGYNFDSSTGEFNFENPDVVHDLANPKEPRTVFGFLTEALRQRREANIAPFTIQSCDNIQHNGNVARKMVLAFANRQDPDLATWIEQEVRFPNAMVDRITPVTIPADIEYVEQELGIKDEWPVTCEPFLQWVIEDQFSAARPAWEDVGAQFVPDVTPYETMKLRLLNAGHSVLGILGSIHGHETIDGCIADPLFAKYLRRFMDVEVTPVLAAVDGIDLDDYKDSLIERFGNSNIKDNLARICLESSAKLPVFLIPTIGENLAAGGGIEFSTLVLAAWCYYSDKHTSKDGVALDVVDAMKDELHEAASKTAAGNWLAYLEVKEVFGDLAENSKFTEVYADMIERVYTNADIASHMRALLNPSTSS